MTGTRDDELEGWAADWQAQPVAGAPPEAVRRHVARRSTLLRAWIVGEAAVALAATAFLGYHVATGTDALDRLLLSLLALVVLAAAVFGAWNWLGALRPSSEATSAYLRLCQERCLRVRRAVRAGWGLLALQAALFVPWVWNRLYGSGAQPPPESVRFAWFWLAGVFALAVVCLLALQAWVRREAHFVAGLRREIEGD